MISYPSINLVDSILDEIALEGLGGITIEALWLRLSHRLHNPLPLAKPFMDQVWSVCVQIREIAFYELESARESLVIFDRYQFVDPDLGIILEPENVPPDIYPHFPIYDAINGIKGSCSTYHTRKDVTELIRTLSLHETLEKYGQKLVIVASQSARNHALMGDDVPPILELNITQYCFLERVGRSRYHGEVTQGKLSLNALKEDPKSLFYHRKFLLRHKLITKQIHHQKSGGHSCNGSLLHLPRFFVERKPKIIFLAEEVIKILKSKPNCVAEYDEIKRKLQIENAIKKLFKTSFFQKVVKADMRVPYRTLYPNAAPAEWQQKNNPAKEKNIKVVQLLSPDIDVLEAWNKDEIPEEDEPQEVNISNHKYCIPYLKQAYAIVEDHGSDGVYQGKLSKVMGLTKLQSRTILRNIVKTNIVATYMNDIGRQRLTKFVSKRYEKASKLSKQFKKEMNKIKELTKQITTESSSIENNVNIIEQDKIAVITGKKENVEEVINPDSVSKSDEKPNTEVVRKTNCTTAELQKLFHVINRMLYKYRLIKRPNRYKCTFSNYIPNQVKGRNTSSNNILLNVPGLSKNDTTSPTYKNIKVVLTVLEPTKTKKSENEVYGFMEDVENSEKKNVTNITYRLLRRANMIIESVKEHQIIDDMTKLMKMINEEEDKEGYDVKIDKKSLIRLLQKLSKDKLVKNIKISLNGNGREKHLTFICDPNLDINSAVVQSAVEQAKLKFYLLSSQKCKSSTKNSVESVEKLRSDRNSNVDVLNHSEYNTTSSNHPGILSGSSKCGPKISRQYGYSPKFVRMQALHIFMFYLVYEHPGEQTVSKAEQIKALRNNDFNITDELAEEFSTVYTNDVSWRMFVPPLPKYNGWPRGWTLMCDVLLRLPLSTFLKIHYISFTNPEVDKYINHPIRKHYLVRDLPVDIRNSLLYARKYIFHIHETVTRLCYIGLVQFGPQRLKEKDQVFIYLNRRTELMDTTSSAPNYHRIEDKVYPVTKYYFQEMQVVEKYWYDMWNTCINTPLGGRLVVQGKDIVLEDLTKKSDMLQAVIARTPEEAEKLDTGKVPGDRKGAAGIDSACFAHLKRNWNWGFGSYGAQPIKNSKNIVYERDTYLSKIKAKPIRFTEFSGLKTVSGPLSVSATELRKKMQTGCVDNISEPSKYEALTYQRTTKQKSYVRRVLPRKRPRKRRTKYDEVDYCALQRMHKLRVDWEPHEDKILLVCKVAMVYICPNPRKQIIPFSAVRDVLRMYSYTSYNKTSKACQRRLLYMLRQQRNINTVTLGVQELNQNFFLRKRFGGIVEKLKEEHKNFLEYEQQVIEAFRSLVTYVAKKYYDISDTGSKEPLPVPMTVQEFNLFYKVIHPTKPLYNRGFTKDIRNINDIHYAIINSVIHSSMCCGKDRRSWAYQLFKIYQQYPEILLRNAMSKIRSDQMVTIKKNQLTTIRKYGNYMPMSSSQYQLSNNYVYKFHTKWPYDIFKESYDVFIKLSNWYYYNQTHESEKLADKFNGIEILPVTGGLIATIHDFVVRNQIDFDIQIPDQVIMLDPRLKEKDETYFRIAKRYQDVLTSLDHLKFGKEPTMQSSYTVTNPEKPNNECLNFDNDRNVDNKSDKDGFSDLDTDKNVISRVDESGKGNIEDSKHFTIYNELNFDSDEETSRNVVDDEQNIIKFQNGIKIVLNRDDVDRLAPCDDNSIMEIEGSQVSCTENSNTVIENTAEVKVPANNIHEDGILNVDHTKLESIVDSQEESIICGNKRQRNVSDQMTNSDEPVHKRTKLNHKVIKTDGEKSKETLLNNEILTNVSNEVQASNLKRHSSSEIDESVDIKRSNNGNTSNRECTSSQQVKKSDKQVFTHVSDILKHIPSEQSCLSSYCKIDDSDMHKRYTRIALLRMREELSELTVADSHHAHDFFVVNMFKILYCLYGSNSEKAQKNEIFKGLSMPLDLLPLRLSVANDVIQEINRFAIFPKEGVSFCDFKKTLQNDLLLNINNLEMVYKFVRDKKELGASIQELMDHFQDAIGEELYSITSFLTENRLFLRSGVTTIRYIHHRHADTWLIHSCKICRLEKESLVPIPKGAVYITENKDVINRVNDINAVEESCENPTSSLENESKIVCETVTEENLPSKTEDSKSVDSDKGTFSHSDDECNMQVKKRMQRKRTGLLPQKDISRAVKQLDLNTKQEIRVVIKPWIRIDGVLNRRVLDRMLGSILSYCLTHPGIALTKIQNRFLPALQPCHTRELVEILIKLGCLDRIILKKSHVTLFSNPSPVVPKTVSNDWAVEEDIFLEPTSGAMIKFGIFLSTKMYNTDFIK